MAASMQQNWLPVAVHNLSNFDQNTTKRALSQIQNFIRSSPGTEPVRHFRECGGLKRLISVLKSSDVELLDLALSVTATCCREPASRKCVQELQGVPILVHILKSKTSIKSIINRASRALANLAEDTDICNLIHNHKAVTLLVKLLNEQEDSNCRQSVIRALRMLASNDKHKWDVTKNECVKALLPCIQSEDEALVSGSIRALATITSYQQLDKPDTVNKFLREAVRQFTADPEHVKTLLQLLSHNKTAIKEQSLIVLVNLIPVDIFRVAIGNAEGITILINESKDPKSLTFPTFLHCLCCCCRESVNRLKVKEHDGLNVLLDVLKLDSEVCRSQHETVLSAMLNFYYDELSLKYLASLGFIRVLVKQLLLSISKAENQSNKCIKDSKLTESSQKQCNSNVKRIDTPKLKKGQDSALSRLTATPSMPIPTQQSPDYSSGLSPETRNTVLGIPGTSAAISPPHMDWSVFMSQRPILVAPDVSPLSSGSAQSASPPRFSPQWSPNCSPQWSSHWSPQWSPDYSPSWEPMWSPQSSPEHSFEAFEMEEENTSSEVVAFDVAQPAEHEVVEALEMGELANTSDEVVAIDVAQPAELEGGGALNIGEANMSGEVRTIGQPVDEEVDDERMDIEKKIKIEPTSLEQNIPSTSSEGHEEEMDSSVATKRHSVTEIPKDKTFRTPDSSKIKSRLSGKRKGKLQNISIKSAKCIQFTPADLPLDAAMSSPSHSSTCTSTGDPENTPQHKGREHDALCMLSRYSHMDKPTKHLMDSEVITGLLDYWINSSNPHSRCWRILIRLIDNRHCFEEMILQMVPVIIYEKLYSSKRDRAVMRLKKTKTDVTEDGGLKSKLGEPSDVDMENVNSLLYRLASMAACHYGEGIMEHLLCVDSVTSQVPCAVAMPYLCRNPKFLKKMLINRGGLDILFGYLGDNTQDMDDPMYTNAVVCVHDLANMQRLQRPLVDIARERSIDILDQAATDLESEASTENSWPCPYTKSSPAHSKVTFKLDDGSTISANRQIIMQQSEYFTRLLDGHYAEANQTDVPLRRISNSALNVVIHHLQGCTLVSCKETKALLENDINVAMETVECAGQYLLPGLQDMISTVIVTDHLSPSCALEMYRLGQLHNCDKLKGFCISYLLCCYEVGRQEFGEMATGGECGDIVLDEMRSAIKDSFV